MICFLFLFAIKFYPDFFHYNLSGTGSYKARLQAIAEANAKIQEELDEKKVGVDYKVTIFELNRVHRRVKRPEVDVSGHAGVGRITSMWSACRRASVSLKMFVRSEAKSVKRRFAAKYFKF